MAKEFDDNVTPETPKKRATRGRPRRSSKNEEAPAEKKTPRIEMTEAQPQEGYEWSPSPEAASKQRGRRGPRREAPVEGERDEMGIVNTHGDDRDSGDDIPTSFRASPEDAPEAPVEEHTEERGESHEQGGNEGGEGQPHHEGGDQQQRGGHQWRDRRFNNRQQQGGRGGRFDRFNRQRGGNFRGGQGGHQRNDRGGDRHQGQQQQRQRQHQQQQAEPRETPMRNEFNEPIPQWEIFADFNALESTAQQVASKGQAYNYSELLSLGANELLERAKKLGVEWNGAPHREQLLTKILESAFAQGLAIQAEGIIDRVGEESVVVFEAENYRLRSISPYLCKTLVDRYGIKRGTVVKVQLHPARPPAEGAVTSKMPIVLKVLSIAGEAPEANLAITPFEELTPFYPTKRILLETHPDAKWDNFSMRIVDLLTPIGFGQRGLIVAPPRTGKTVLMQGMANAIAENHPDAHLMVLLVDERPEEVTDFKRQVKGEVISSTFDETAQSHVHAAEIVIEKARRMVERGKHVVILLDSITRLARAYNAMTGNSGKIMSGGVESTALQKPKRFFGSARNIENGGSLTILGTALVDTGSKMDEVIFEEFKGTGNMELHLDRSLVDKRLFPAIALDKSGTRKEELLYHPDETQKVYGLRRAMKGVTPIEAMEMLLSRVKKTRTNIEFLMGLSR